MGEIRLVGTGKTHGYPYLVCKKFVFIQVTIIHKHIILKNYDLH